ncbi:MAG: hypothetical protein ACE5LU_06815 [Anaerolineae bacterium]
MSSRYLSTNERRSRLEVVISDHVIKGYEVVDREMTWVEMYKPKRFSPRGCLFGLGIFYLIYYALYQAEHAVYLEMTPQGDLVKRDISTIQAAAKWAQRTSRK